VRQRLADKTEWTEVGRDTIDRFTLQGLHRENLRINFPEQREARYQIVIENADSPPLDITSITAEGNVYRLDFLGSPDQSYRVVYGSEIAESPRYDTAAVLSSVGSGYRPASLSLGNQVEDTSYRARNPTRGMLEQQIVLILALALMVAVLAWLLLRAGRQIKQLPIDEIS
jgi:hypothetical protein